ncbi:MAG: hypothetical protein PHQ23_10500 [Candidatus Wallbacteria bacterium]|nr:hypothetical protein [Candidatus Wallbacteria bacterium]
MQLIKLEYLTWLSAKDCTEPDVPTGYKPKAGDIVMFRGNVFMAIIAASGKVRALPATQYHGLCHEHCLVLETDCPLTEAWGVLPRLLEPVASVLDCCEQVDTVNIDDLKLLAASVKSGKPLPAGKRGLTYEDKTAYPYLFSAYETMRVEHELSGACYIDAPANTGRGIDPEYPGTDLFSMIGKAARSGPFSLLKRSTNFTALTGVAAGALFCLNDVSAFKTDGPQDGVSLSWDKLLKRARIEMQDVKPGVVCEIFIRKNLIYRGPVRKVFVVSLGLAARLLSSVMALDKIIAVRIFPQDWE